MEIVVDDFTVDEWGVSVEPPLVHIDVAREIQREIDKAEKAAKFAIFYGAGKNKVNEVLDSWKKM